jgi:cell division protease FtsH
MSLPERDRYSHTKQEIKSKLASMYGGRIAEELIFGAEKITTGAANDIQQATGLARKMVTEWGMSDKLGPLRYDANDEEVFLGHSVTQHKNISDATAGLIDQEIRAVIEEAESKARTILSEELDKLHAVAEALLEYETLSGSEVEGLLNGQDIVRAAESEVSDSSVGKTSSVPPTGTAGESDLSPNTNPGG